MSINLNFHNIVKTFIGSCKTIKIKKGKKKIEKQKNIYFKDYGVKKRTNVILK